MSFENYSSITVDRMGSLVTGYDRKKLSHGVAPAARNVRYGLNFVATRYGLARAIQLPENCNINGLGALVRVGLTTPYVPLVFSDTGNLYQESPVGTSLVRKLTPSTGSLPEGAFMEMQAAYQRAYLAFNDLEQGVSDGYVTDGSVLDPHTQRPVGETWQPNTLYFAGEVVTPTLANGHIYRCTKGGTSSAIAPNFPVTPGLTVADGGAIWQEANVVAITQIPAPVFVPVSEAQIPAGGAWPAGRDVYVAYTYVNGSGESLPGPIGVFLNTILNVLLEFDPPPFPHGLENLFPPYLPTGYQAYVANVAHGAGAPALATFQQAAGGPFIFGNVFGSAAQPVTGINPPVANTANVSPAGNVTTGLRFFGVLFVNRQGNISGFTRASAQFINITGANLQFFIGNIPLGPSPTTQQRILVFGLPGATQDLVSVSGPYLYIAEDDPSTGENILSTVIDDNVTTSGYFNFTDAYLQESTDATDFLRAIKLPPQASIRYIVALHRLATMGEAGQPSLIRFSETDMPGTFYGDTGYNYLRRDDGQKVYGVGEFKNQVYAAKERAGYILNTSTGEPSSWGEAPAWTGSGPSGFDAIVFASDFIAWANESGAWIYQGTEPEEITLELSDQETGVQATRDCWKNINWAGAGNTVQACADEQKKELRFVVPMGDATMPSKTFTVNYRQGWDKPIVFSSFAGKLITHPDARKWSVDDIQANRMVRVWRPLSQAQIQDGVEAKTQILVGSNQNDGLVYMIQPDNYSDNGAGIDSYYETAPVGIDDLENPNIKGGLARLGGFVATMEGNGKITAMRVDYQGKVSIWDRLIDIRQDPNLYYRRYGNFLSRKWGIGFWNGKQPGAWFKLLGVDIYVQQFKVQEMPVSDARG